MGKAKEFPILALKGSPGLTLPHQNLMDLKCISVFIGEGSQLTHNHMWQRAEAKVKTSDD